jgi:class 3 adenylate cyclase
MWTPTWQPSPQHSTAPEELSTPNRKDDAVTDTPRSNGASATVLVVDDDPLNRQLLSMSIGHLGHGVLEAGNGLEAIDVLATHDVDVVLTDIEMPEMDGYGLLEHRADEDRLRAIPFIVISGVDEMASIIRCIGLGAEDYLPKPFDPVLLHARLGASLDRKRMTDELQQLNEHLAERVDEKVAEVERLNSLRRFVSPQLAEALAVGGEEILASHRREITAFFCDLRGFTAFSETAEPEEVMDVLSEFHHAVGPMIFDHDGTIAQFTGDGMLVFFNDPVKLDDPAWNAVQLAVAMRDRTSELSAEWKRRGHDLELGIGIAVGYATCGEIGFDGRTEYTAIGTVVNLSARVCSIAAGGQILVTNKVFTAVDDRVESTPLGNTEFKGLSRPVAIHEVTALR